MASEKFKELILYIAQESELDPSFGATKLNKLLFFSDFLSFRSSGRSISGERYFKLPFGPAPRALKPALQELIAEDACEEIERHHFGRSQKRLWVHREPKLEGLFSATEVAWVARVIRTLWGNNATEVSELSHLFIGWQLASDQEDIPYETVFLGDPRELSPTEEEIAYGRELDRELAHA